MACAVHFTLKSEMVSYLIICPANSMTTQLQKQWTFYYIPIFTIAQFFLDCYTTTDSIWLFWPESKMLW